MPYLQGTGSISKLKTALDSPVSYHLPIGESRLPLNECLGKTLRLESLGLIHCSHCGRRTKKSYSQGYCYPCMIKLASCDTCIMSPERCHHHLGTCREPAWGEQFCMTDHIVYLANSSGLKVGITRATQVPTRWIDQGASQALPIMRVSTRLQSGLVEDLLRQQVADKTNWRALLKGEPEPVDMLAARDRLLDGAATGIMALQQQHGLQAIQPLQADVTDIRYPVLQYSAKPQSANLDKEPVLEGTLLGIKGQYLILDTGVINIRKYTAYTLSVSVS
ncbi:DUF2797 domain-containing protein [Halopseudomonas pelagia]|uniref:DUF2797 domain-containing protein n=1 Tax=Halopseudomonas pelagia TaxID=553151 RepID=A0AA91U635_9GAMM|nr:DUF2797 domain-containing protein [Halopseudomonas pelagia]PCD01248.1 hypothetical protein CO192_01085 [Halopseudomonas pelagia]QFY57538.1 DUF2797 domain-containing protein [Halopseudomonas pelagia]